ncbi:MAG: hypothetical protein Q7R49_01815 [Candidatus Daviesbacteria bacterium]|nr:hypothetical protein [Candidatus Daviesbacteria bacterium]
MLESLDRLNIGSINLPEPQISKRGFDVATMVSETDLVRIGKAIPGLKAKGGTDFHNAVFSLSVIAPAEADKFQGDEGLKIGLASLENLAYLKLSFPQIYREVSQGDRISLKESGENLYRHLRSLISSADKPWPSLKADAIDIPRSLFEARVLYPLSAFQDLIDIFVPGMVKTLGTPPSHLDPLSYYALGRWLIKARTLRIIAPETGIEINPDEEVWEEMKRQVLPLKKNRFRGSLIVFTNMVADMKVLAAEEIKITNQGLDLIMSRPKVPITEAIPALPEVRKF